MADNHVISESNFQLAHRAHLSVVHRVSQRELNENIFRDSAWGSKSLMLFFCILHFLC